MTGYSAVMSLMLAGIFSCHPALAAGEMNFGGTLIEPPPCTINSGGLIDVNFQQRVGINKVDGVNYLQTIDYKLVCDPSTNPWEVRLTVSGNATAYDPAAVQTNIDGLGIRLLQNGLPFTLNTSIIVPHGGSMVLQAVPVKKPGVTLPEGAFEASATLQAEYQ